MALGRELMGKNSNINMMRMKASMNQSQNVSNAQSQMAMHSTQPISNEQTYNQYNTLN